MFQYGVLILGVNEDGEESDVLYEYPVDGLDTALENYKKLVKMYPSKKFKLVRIEYTVMEVLDDYGLVGQQAESIGSNPIK